MFSLINTIVVFVQYSSCYYAEYFMGGLCNRMIILKYCNFQIYIFVADSAFKQQRLPAWQPILTAGTVLPTFFVIGIAFIPVGIGLLHFSDEVKEHVIDYTHCNRTIIKSDVWDTTNETCIDYLHKNKNIEDRPDCNCRIKFNLEQNFQVKYYVERGYLYLSACLHFPMI